MNAMTAPVMTGPKLTQKQIAEQLGVSRQLVGFALRGEGRMSDELRSQILLVAQQNGYHQYSNREARAMVSRRYGKRAVSGIVAVLFEATFENQPLSSVPFFMPFFTGLEAEAIRHGIDLALCALRPKDLPRLVTDGQVDGAICLLAPEDIPLRVQELGLPLVNILYKGERQPNLLIDDARGVQLAVRHLLELGHRRIAYIGSVKQLATERLLAFRAEMQAAGLLDESLIVCKNAQPSARTGHLLMHQLLERKAGAFSAVVAFNDTMGFGVVGAIQQAGYDVPRDISVVGFDDVSRSHNFSPALTSINFSRHDIGQRAIELLCMQLQDGAAALRDAMGADLTEVFPVELVVRDSTQRHVSG